MGELVGVIFFLLVFAAPFALLLWYARSRMEKLQRRLQRFANRLDQGVLSGGYDGSLFGGLNGSQVRGMWNGRRVILRLEQRGSGKHAYTAAVYQMRIPNATGDFEIKRAGMLSKVGRWLGLVEDTRIGNKSVDDKYIMKGGRSSLKKVFGRGGDMERALDRLFNARGFQKVRLRRGLLTVERAMLDDHLRPENLDSVFRQLEKVGRLCDRRKVKVKLKGRKKTEIHFGWTGGGEHVLCPYCRDAVDTQGDLPISVCEQCDTLHHEACLSEAGGCTVFGCQGGRRGRVRG